MIGAKLSHYRITAKLGEGGMGEVYLAEDTELDRKVAIKVLPAELSEEEDRLERFRREAKAVAALNHPNIVTIYSIEENEGRRFLIMELVEGESLDRALPPGGLPLAKVFDIAIPLADALASAHEKGIVHRDLKPANVMMTPDGRVKVLDFGLAKLAVQTGHMPADADATQMAPSSATLTREGVVMGTAPYMSPEQLQGQSVDHRSDIFSLGVLLYEMVSGARPFRGENSAALVSSIMRDTPAPVFEQRADLPRHLGRIIQGCLEKDPRERFQSSLDVRNQLKSLQKEVESGTYTSMSGSAVMPAVAAPPPTPASGAPSAPGTVASTQPPVEPSVAAPTPASGGQVHQQVSDPSTVVPPAAAAAPSGPVQAAASSGRGRMIGVVAAIVVIALATGWWLGRGRDEDRAPTPAETAKTSTAEQAKPVAAVTETPSVAVLPFADRSPEGDQEYFTDGLTEELINALAKAGDLRVAGRRSSFQFKNSDDDLKTIGEKLNVTTVLEGSVRKAGDQMRITAELVQVDDGFSLWSETYDRSFDDIFEVQDDIAAAVASALQVTLAAGKTVEANSASTDAYNLLLQAKFLLERNDRNDIDEAIALLEESLAIDSGYAPAWAELGLAHFRRAFVEDDEAVREASVRRGRQSLEKALEIDPELPEALSRMGWVLGTQELDFVAADAFTQRALDVAPNNPIVLGNASSMASIFGRLDEAIAYQRKVLEIDPLDLTVYGNGANTFLEARMYDEAIDYLTKLQSLSPGYPYLHAGFGRVYLAQGRLEAALAETEQEPDQSSRLSLLALIHFSLENRQLSDKSFEDYKAEFGNENPYTVASIHAYRGEIDDAFALLERAYVVRDSALSSIKMDINLESLHSDPRWEPFLAKMGLAD
jgi:serine/threonine protein kinase/TolB-like protein